MTADLCGALALSGWGLVRDKSERPLWGRLWASPDYGLDIPGNQGLYGGSALRRRAKKWGPGKNRHRGRFSITTNPAMFRPLEL